MNRLNRYLPNYYKGSETFEEIIKSHDSEFDTVYDNIEDLNKQFLVKTATWGLDVYEEEFGLPINPNRTLDERRSIIIAKIRGTGKVDNVMIQAIVEAFTSNRVEIEFDGRINIVFPYSTDLNISSGDMFKFVEEVIPAHLDYRLEARIERVIKIITEISYGFSLFPLCNTVEAGEWPYQQNLGKLIRSNAITETRLNGGPVNYKDTATIVASENLYEEHQFGIQATHRSAIKAKLSYFEREVGYIEANEILSGEYPYAVVEGKVIDTGIAIKSNIRADKFIYPETALVVSSEELYEEYKFAEVTDFEFGSTARHHVSLRELDYKKSGEVISGDHPYTKNLAKVSESQITKKEKSRSGVSPYRLCGETHAREDK